MGQLVTRKAATAAYPRMPIHGSQNLEGGNVGKIVVLRTWENKPRGVQHFVEQKRDRLIQLYGRPDLSISLQNAVADHSRSHEISLKVALAQMIDAHGSFEALDTAYRNKAKKDRARFSKARKKVSLGKSPIPFGSVYKEVQFLQGGAPGLGRKRKPICSK